MRKIMMGTCLVVGFLAAGASVPAVAAVGESKPASADAYDSYSERVFYDSVKWWAGQKWSGTCKDGYWLDTRAGTSGRSVGQGFVVHSIEDSGVVVTEYPSKRVMDGAYVQGSGGDAVNLIPFFDEAISIRMVCTNDPAYAWGG